MSSSDWSFLPVSACRHADRTIASLLITRSSRLVSHGVKFCNRKTWLPPRCLLESFESIREDFKRPWILDVKQIHRSQRERCPLRSSSTAHTVRVSSSLRDCRTRLHSERHPERCTNRSASVRLIANGYRSSFCLASCYSYVIREQSFLLLSHGFDSYEIRLLHHLSVPSRLVVQRAFASPSLAFQRSSQSEWV